jgi:hypothetical protein
LFSRDAAIKPPAIIPAAKNRFQASFFQLYRKKEILAGKQAAQICRREEEIPNVLLPSISKSGTVKPINGPATHQGQGCFMISMKCIYREILGKVQKNIAQQPLCNTNYGIKFN